MRVVSLDHMVIDVERSADWYTRVLGMTRLDYGTDPDHPRHRCRLWRPADQPSPHDDDE